MIRVLIVDDHSLFAEGLKSMFKPADGIEVVRHTINGNEVPAVLDEIPIDVILMDIDMPVIDGVATMQMLKEKGYDQPVLMLTMHQSIKQIKRALEKGALGYILKDAHKKELVEAIQMTSIQKSYFHPKISNEIFDYFRGKRVDENQVNVLSERELEIVSLIADGLQSRAIAERLHLSEHTIKTHRRNIMHKLHVKTSAELIQYLNQKGII